MGTQVPQTQATQQGKTLGPGLNEESQLGGMTMSPPGFSLTASPIQRRPNPNQTNYAVDTGRLTASDLQDPEVVARLQAMSTEQLQQYLTSSRDAAVQSYVQSLISQRQSAPQSQNVAATPVTAAAPVGPAAASVVDATVKVLPADLAMYNDLTTALQALPARLRTLVATPPAASAFLHNNPNADAVVNLTAQVAADFVARRHVVRFDPAMLRGAVAASYDFASGNIRLRPFTNAGDRAEVITSLLHEYTHFVQDQAVESRVATSQSSDDHDREDEIQHEIGARQTQVYMAHMMRDIGELPAVYAGLINDEIFLHQFETMRTGNRRARGEARAMAHEMIEDAYRAEGQLDRNSPAVTHYAFLTDDNHIHLRIQGHDLDIGEAPAAARSPQDLSSFMADRILADAHHFGVFDRRAGRRRSTYRVASFLLYYQGRKLTEFAINPPARP